MPSRRIHEYLDMLLFGKRYSWLHKWMDEPYKRLGKNHRLMRHNPIKTPFEAFIISGGDWKAYISAANHIMMDEGVINPAITEALRLINKLKGSN